MIDFLFQDQGGEVGYLLHKNPNTKIHTFKGAYGEVELRFESGDDGTKMRFDHKVEPQLVVVDKTQGGHPLAHYVSAVPYEVGSLTASALKNTFSTLLAGVCKSKPELVDKLYTVKFSISALSCPESIQDRVLACFGEIGAITVLKRAKFHVSLAVLANTTLKDLFRKLIVLIRTADGKSHFRMSDQDMEAFLKLGEGWLEKSPNHAFIRRRVLGDMSLIREYDQKKGINQGTGQGNDQIAEQPNTRPEEENKPSAYDARVDAVYRMIRDRGYQKVVDLGGGGGKFIQKLLENFKRDKLKAPSFVLVEPNGDERSYAWRRFKKDVPILFGAYGFELPNEAKNADCYLLVEVIEHLHNPDRAYLQHLLSQGDVVITTPNAEYNQLWDLKPDQLRHWDHKFEWTRIEFTEFVCSYGNVPPKVISMDIGEYHEIHGPLTQGYWIEKVQETPVYTPPPLPNKQGFQALLRLNRELGDLPWLPCTVSPVSGGIMEKLRAENPDETAYNVLEHPEAAFVYYEAKGVKQVVVQDKHMGSRMVYWVDYAKGKSDFLSRTGRSMLYKQEEQFVRAEIQWCLNSLIDFLKDKGYLNPNERGFVVDGELLPWSIKAGNLLTDVYAPLVSVSNAMLEGEGENTSQVYLSRYKRQLEYYSRGWIGDTHYAIWSIRPNHTNLIGDAEFQKLFAEWQNQHEAAGRINLRVKGTESRVVNLENPAERMAVAERFNMLWCEKPDQEGFMIKPVLPWSENFSIAPMIKVRNPEYLRLIYGPEYTRYLDRLKGRSVSGKIRKSISQALAGERAFNGWINEDQEKHERGMLALLGEDDSDLDPRL